MMRNSRYSVERRSRDRFGIRLPMWFCVSWRSRAAQWTRAETIDISASGLRLARTVRCAIGSEIKMAVDWPVRREDGAPLALIASGVIVHKRRGTIGVRFVSVELVAMDRYEQPMMETAVEARAV